MSKSILYYFGNLILGDGYKNELENFHLLLSSVNRDFSKDYDHDEKIVYMFDRIPDEHDNFIVNPQSSHPVIFRDQLKSKVIEQYKIVERRLSEKWEMIEHLQNKKVFLDKQYTDIIRIQERYLQSEELQSYDFLKTYLEKIELCIGDLYEISKLDTPTKIESPFTFKRKTYKVELPSQDDIVECVRSLKELPRFKNSSGQLKPTTIRAFLLDENNIEGINNISERALFNRVKDAIKELAFYEAESTS